MSNYQIISDSSFDLTCEIRQRFGICDDYIKAHIVFSNGHYEIGDCDYRNMTSEEYFSLIIKKNIMCHSSISNIQEVNAILEKYLLQGDDILVISNSSNFTNTYFSFLKCHDRFIHKYPQRKIVVIDSLRYSGSLALLCVYAGILKRNGLSIEQNAKWIEEHKNCIHQIWTLDNCSYLKRKGIISRKKAIMNLLTKRKLIGDFTHNGKTTVLARISGKNNSLKASVEYIKRTIVDAENQIILVSHSFCKETAKKFIEMIHNKIRGKEIIVTEIGQSNAADIGPGLVAASYLGYTISENNIDEKKIMKEVIETI